MKRGAERISKLAMSCLKGRKNEAGWRLLLGSEILVRFIVESRMVRSYKSISLILADWKVALAGPDFGDQKSKLRLAMKTKQPSL